MKNINNKLNYVVVVGYPRSGTTYLTLLVSDLIGCRSEGYLAEDGSYDPSYKQIGSDLNYVCYKSHHQYHELNDFHIEKLHIIYILRDPRDVVISCANYFVFEKYENLRLFLQKIPFGLRLFYPIFYYKKYDYMIDTLLNGRVETNYWCRIPWKTHLNEYLQNRVFYIRYEDLIDNPKHECLRILDYLNIERDSAAISDAIELNNGKIQNKNSSRLKHLKTGGYGKYKNILSYIQRGRLYKELKNEMKMFGYE
jgi:hypothetical protein